MVCLGEILSRNSTAPNPVKHLYAASKIPPLNDKWPARSGIQITRMSSPARHVFQHADLIRKKLRVDSIDLLQFHVWTIVGPMSRNFARRWKSYGVMNHPFLRHLASIVGTGERYQGAADWTGRHSAGDPQHF